MKPNIHKNRINNKLALKLTKSLKGKKGVTLIELIITFALISLFLVLSCQAISSALNVYYRIQSVNYGLQVSDTLMDKIAGEISSAQVGVRETGVENEDLNTGYTLQIIEKEGADGIVDTAIDFYDGSGSHIYIANGIPMQGGDKQLLIHYYSVKTVQPDSSKKEAYKPVDWTFDKKMYLGYKIKKLEFSLADPKGIVYPKNVIKIDLTIESEKFREYSSTRYVECYNFKSEDDFSKIYGPGM